MATSGDFLLATDGDFLMAMDSQRACGGRGVPSGTLQKTLQNRNRDHLPGLSRNLYAES